MVPSADERYSSDGRATTTMKKATTTMKRKSGSKEAKGGDSPARARFPSRTHSGGIPIPRARAGTDSHGRGARTDSRTSISPPQLIDARIKELNDWRGETLARVRMLIKQADPDVIEEWKWRGVPVWEHAGIICTGE